MNHIVFCTSKLITCHVVSLEVKFTLCAKHTCMRSMPMLGGSGGMPPQKILKIAPSEIESESILNDLSTYNDISYYERE